MEQTICQSCAMPLTSEDMYSTEKDGRNCNMDLKKIERFIDKQKVSIICSIDDQEYPNVKAMLKFTATSGRFYCDLKTESFEIK